MHGGTKQLDPSRTCWSQVTHYFFDECAYYTPMMSDPFYGSIAFRTLTNIMTGQQVPNRVTRYAVPARFIETTTPGQMKWQEEKTFDVVVPARQSGRRGGWRRPSTALLAARHSRKAPAASLSANLARSKQGQNAGPITFAEAALQSAGLTQTTLNA